MNNVDFDIDLTIILREIGRYVCRIIYIPLDYTELRCKDIIQLMRYLADYGD